MRKEALVAYFWGIISAFVCRDQDKVNVRFTLCLTKYHVIKTYWGSGSIDPRIP